MLPDYLPITIKQGATFRFWFALNLSGSVLNPTTTGPGYTYGYCQIRDKPNDEGGVVLLELTTANGGMALGSFTDGSGATQSGYLYASPAATAALVGWGDGCYEVRIRDAGNTDDICILEGPAVLSPAVAVP
ncbi:MAG: hypothetical protein WBA46_00975 [Thermomicrobiales bacterium]